MRTLRRIPRSLLIAGTILVAGAALAAFLRGGAPAADDVATETDARPNPVAAAPSPPPIAAEPAPAPLPAPPSGPLDADAMRAIVNLASAAVENGKLVQHLSDGSTLEYAIDVAAQAAVQEVFDRFDVPVGAAVAIEVKTGRVVVFASRSRGPVERDPCLDASPPAASLFKLITASALIEDVGVSPDARQCYRGVVGIKRFNLADLDLVPDETDPNIACATLSEAVSRSLNPVLGRLADQKLSPRILLRRAERFVFGRAIPFDLPLDVSPVEIPQDRLEFARTAAGFWHVGLSPLHAAAIAQAIANGGKMLRPTLIDRLVGPDGVERFRPEPQLLRTVVAPETAEALGKMMLGTVDSGTARKEFYDQQNRPYLSVAVAGKTGSLVNPSPYLSYSWFIGFAPQPVGDGPAWAVAVLVVNEERWRIKAAFAAREVLRVLLTPAS